MACYRTGSVEHAPLKATQALPFMAEELIGAR
jgi:hypothetical protein